MSAIYGPAVHGWLDDHLAELREQHPSGARMAKLTRQFSVSLADVRWFVKTCVEKIRSIRVTGGSFLAVRERITR